MSIQPAHRIISCRDPRGWSMPRGRPQASWLRQVESYLKNAGMTGLVSAGRWPDGGRRRTVARWTRLRTGPVYAPIPNNLTKTIANQPQIGFVNRSLLYNALTWSAPAIAITLAIALTHALAIPTLFVRATIQRFPADRRTIVHYLTGECERTVVCNPRATYLFEMKNTI